MMHMLLCSNATLIAVRCCAHVVDKIAMSGTEIHLKCRSAHSNNASGRNELLENPSSIAWAQHLKALNVALEHNRICIYKLYRIFFEEIWCIFGPTESIQKSVTLLLVNHRAMYSWDNTPLANLHVHTRDLLEYIQQNSGAEMLRFRFIRKKNFDFNY
jgi:hypothetical protein